MPTRESRYAVMSPLAKLLKDYLAGEPTDRDSLALLRPFQVAAAMEHDLETDLIKLMLLLYRRRDQPTLLRRLVRFAETRRPATFRRYQAATTPLFADHPPSNPAA